MITPQWQSIRRLLVIRLDNLGDVILISPAVASLARGVPNAAITLLASPAGAQAGELHPDISEVLVYDAPWVDPWQHIPHDSSREQAMIARLKEMQFDAAVIFTSYRQSSLPAAYLCYLADIPLRLGISHDASGSLLTTRHRPSQTHVHEVERGLDLIRAVGFQSSATNLNLVVPNSAREAVDRWVIDRIANEREGGLIIVHPGCTMPARTYSWESYADVIAGLVLRLGATVVLTGTAPEQPLVDRIVDRLPPEVRDVVLLHVGNHQLGYFAALIERADLVITNNTGPMHVAAAVGTPSVVLFALTNAPEQWRPWRAPHRLLFQDVPCRICYSRSCPLDHHRCLTGVPPESVVAAAREMMEEAAVSLAWNRA